MREREAHLLALDKVLAGLGVLDVEEDGRRCGTTTTSVSVALPQECKEQVRTVADRRDGLAGRSERLDQLDALAVVREVLRVRQLVSARLLY